MARGLVRSLSTLVLCLAIAGSAFAQQGGQEEKKLSGTRRQLAVIVFSGLGGAVLGLSTLSFYGRPQDHLPNIAIGFALGVIGGAVYTTYNATQDPKKFHGEEDVTQLLGPTHQASNQVQIPIFQYKTSF